MCVGCRGPCTFPVGAGSRRAGRKRVQSRAKRSTVPSDESARIHQRRTAGEPTWIGNHGPVSRRAASVGNPVVNPVSALLPAFVANDSPPPGGCASNNCCTASLAPRAHKVMFEKFNFVVEIKKQHNNFDLSLSSCQTLSLVSRSTLSKILGRKKRVHRFPHP